MDVPTEETAKEKAMRKFKDDASSANCVFGRHRAQPPATGNICALRVLEELQGKSLSMSKPQVRSYTEAVATPVGTSVVCLLKPVLGWTSRIFLMGTKEKEILAIDYWLSGVLSYAWDLY
ncbi:uncharacterized protein RAG0_08231 [Rhynchosporium agropyri]|uniref:Uncharacterized protein n=1 Tax=Rhynchosporium agropyri TaxID=914238 RepID=A0A1E1KPX9_9HELO|nr:uncharacterized protein RAG0_08231 [Rhynchosporium agropyri]